MRSTPPPRARKTAGAARAAGADEPSSMLDPQSPPRVLRAEGTPLGGGGDESAEPLDRRSRFAHSRRASSMMTELKVASKARGEVISEHVHRGAQLRTAMIKRKQRERMKKMFEVVDANHNGELDLSEIMHIVPGSVLSFLGEDGMSALIAQFDTNDSGTIREEQMMEFMKEVHRVERLAENAAQRTRRQSVQAAEMALDLARLHSMIAVEDARKKRCSSASAPDDAAVTDSASEESAAAHASGYEDALADTQDAAETSAEVVALRAEVAELRTAASASAADVSAAKARLQRAALDAEAVQNEFAEHRRRSHYKVELLQRQLASARARSVASALAKKRDVSDTRAQAQRVVAMRDESLRALVESNAQLQADVHAMHHEAAALRRELEEERESIVVPMLQDTIAAQRVELRRALEVIAESAREREIERAAATHELVALRVERTEAAQHDSVNGARVAAAWDEVADVRLAASARILALEEELDRVYDRLRSANAAAQ